MAFPLAAAIIGSSLISGIFSKKAAGQQARGTQAAIEAQNRLLGPFAEAGAAGLGGLQEFVGEGARFGETQAFKDITNLAKAGRGAGFGSGNLLTSLIDFQQRNFRPQRLQELLALPTLGVTAASRQAANLGELQQSLGATRAGGTLGAGGAITGGLGSLAFLSLLNRPGGGVNNAAFLGQAGLGG